MLLIKVISKLCSGSINFIAEYFFLYKISATHLIMYVLLCMRVLNGNAYEKVINVFCSGLQLALVNRL